MGGFDSSYNANGYVGTPTGDISTGGDSGISGLSGMTGSGITTGLQALLGLYQIIKGSGSVTRPDYTIPKEITDLLTSAKTTAAQTESPYSQQELNQINAEQSNILGAVRKVAESAADIQGVLPGLQAQTNQGIQGIAKQNIDFWTANQEKLANAEQLMAQYKDKQFDINKQQPYEQELYTKNLQTQGGIQNMYGAIGGFMNNLMGYQTQQGYMDLAKKQMDITDAHYKAMEAAANGGAAPNYSDVNLMTPKSAQIPTYNTTDNLNPINTPQYNMALRGQNQIQPMQGLQIPDYSQSNTGLLQQTTNPYAEQYNLQPRNSQANQYDWVTRYMLGQQLGNF